MRVSVLRGPLLIALTLIAVACGSPLDDNANGGLANTSWTVTSVGDVASIAATRPTMAFAPDGTVTGNSGCNQYSGTYRTDGSSIRITNVASTMMMCAGPGADIEAPFLKGLNGATSWRQTETGTLEIAGAVGIVAGHGVAEGPPDDQPRMDLQGTTWILAEMGGTADFAHIVPTLAFGADGTISGFAGCNTFTGTYTPDGHIRPLMATKIGCQRPASVVEDEYLTALSGVTGWSLVDGQIRMDGPVPLTFGPG
jgi:heat shock protein HslJ